MPNKIITLTAFNRPGYLREVLAGLAGCRGIADYTILAHVEPGCDEVIEMLGGIRFCAVELTLNSERLWIPKNTLEAWSHGFERSDFIIHMEDDVVPAPDCLRYMEHCAAQYESDQEFFSVSSYNRRPVKPADYFRLERRPGFVPWLVGIWRSRWQWARDHWLQAPGLYSLHLSREARRAGLKAIHPLLSRAKNIGVEGTNTLFPDHHRLFQHTDHWAGNMELGKSNFHEV